MGVHGTLLRQIGGMFVTQKPSLQPEQRETLDLIKKVLQRVVEEVNIHNVSMVDLEIHNQAIFYCFKTKEGKRGKGTISTRAREALLKYVEDVGEGEKISLNNKVSPCIMQVKLLSKEPFCHVQLSWGEMNLEQPQEILAQVVPFPTSFINSTTRQVVEKVKAEKPQVFLSEQVLVIDDNETFSAILERFFERNSIRTKNVTSCKDALNLILNEDWKPDLVICDLHLPEMDGFKFLNEVRKNPKGVNLPVVILTSDEDVEAHIQALKQGADAFLTKTTDPRLLCAQVNRLLEKGIKNTSLT